ncbi:MAG: sulfatase-like hydrolase/transferase [Acidobacteriota bacterium]
MMNKPISPAVALVLALLGSSGSVAAEGPPNVLLVTLDTTRSDALGAYGGAARTPNLDGIAERGVRFDRAITAAPITLPAHASLLTGLDPPEHGVRDNGLSALPGDLPTLATRFAAAGYATAAVVASRVLDRRFGLARGFDHYDDSMAAEVTGEYGYAERDATAVTAAARRWLAGRAGGKPFFLWVHYYDPHAPYQPAAEARDGYRGEIEKVDTELGRLLAAIPDGALVAVVADHGESLGEHGEKGHGIFLYRAVVEVPLMLAGPGVPTGKVVTETVAARRLAPTLTALARVGELPGTVLPGVFPQRPKPPPEAVFSESTLPARAYGWSPLTALTDGAWRLVVAPKPELFDVARDPAEDHNRLAEESRVARRLKRQLRRLEAEMGDRQAEPAGVDAELAAAVRSLGYTAGGVGDRRRDPKDGMVLLNRLAEAKEQLQRGDVPVALATLRELVKVDPKNLPFWTNLARAQGAGGDLAGAVASYRQAVRLNPGLDLLRISLGDALAEVGDLPAAEAEYRRAIELDPRSASAWLRRAELAARAGRAVEERRLLTAAAQAGADSAALLTRLAQVELAAGDTTAAAQRLRRATELLPSWPTVWLVLGQVHLARGDWPAAKRVLERTVELAPEAPEGRQARRWLAELAARQEP